MSSNCFLPELDRKKTQEALEAEFEKYRIFKAVTFEEKEASTTSSYTERFHGPTNVTSDSTADVAIYNVDTQASRMAHIQRIDRAVSRLHPKEQLLIRERYLKQDYVFDYVIYNQVFNPPISEKTYAKIRWKAFYKLALALNVAVEKKYETGS
ncbi:ArpU family phage packaging/lysis transcriptional regulator [Paenibacillus larvae]|uniref:ArpU-like transcriptional regulator n=1 Tax=Bacteriophage Lily TaxID=1589751 RepID=A0A0C5AJ96_9CAUD|nr:ArpU family phage packaging/lysis transcriptional regulator [Paenibacillus larvae]YP_009202275.1 transcriptional activator [Bacteriophage Lily]AJK27793.1 ArpU-like transcriptional regulator [Bacteriophage Lily]MCY9564807.1 transcriptional regulator [Paenibacillus larvae]MCY9566820.1 transcriptional regulator [Paenibacillus larvae]MCY9571866.1 transcriptional regulator [Paenibacillus larvae]MCY9690578.1 transcriptional regulator [Paenibacillus larvae]